MRTFTKDDVLEQAQEYNVKFIRMQFTDIFGIFKNIAITVEELPKAMEGRIRFDSSVIDGMVGNREREICLHPDPASFVIFPWRPREGAVARLICDIVNPDGTAYECCCRNVLKKVVTEAEAMDLRMMVGVETEFFLFQTDDRNKPTVLTHDTAGYCDLSPVDLGENARRDMVLTLEEMGFEIGSSHHEFAPGQHEISLKTDDALSMADKLVTFRFVVRTIARRHGLHASFMPKPDNNLNGSALHIYQTLFQGLENTFYDPRNPGQLSDTARHYVGGLISHAPSFAVLTNPIVNSYKRLIPGDLSPCYVAWSTENRNTIIRVPANRAEETRVELRNPDPACNPYLVLAVLLKSGLAGVKAKVQPSRPVSDNLFALSPAEYRTRDVLTMPQNLEKAVDLLKQDELIIKTIGEELTHKYITAKQMEWQRFQSHVHSWELEEYLPLF
ncbi:glutamine synthetase family protein [Phosphitispora fastidiosa]|uniref:glutamine synthetase family protein n=1 Tax=Phosphitispora fastidiosa TaxID=2837202 RepID=UPI001E5F2AB0|nr:glutamine synthetase family protein [Phosphitispora fastidiosa]MBU7007972.1 glutamine synthetase [Phosphitispora fastidiosa]